MTKAPNRTARLAVDLSRKISSDELETLESIDQEES